MSKLWVGLLGAFLLWGSSVEPLVLPVQAQVVGASLACDEAGLLDAKTYSIAVRQGAKAGSVKLAFGDLGGECIPTPVLASLSFVMAWTKKHPNPVPVSIQGTTVQANEVTLVLPAQTFVQMQQSKPDEVQVQVQAWTLKHAGGTYAGSGQLTLQRQGGRGWRVTSVVSP